MARKCGVCATNVNVTNMSVKEARKTLVEAGFSFARGSVANHLLHVNKPSVSVSNGLEGPTVTVGPTGGEISSGTVTAPVKGDGWGRIFELLNLDPAVYEIVNDTITMSTWQQSKALDDGTRDVVQLYSYKAKFRKISKVEGGVVFASEVWRKALLKTSKQLQTVTAGVGCYIILVADPQLGKKGTAEAVSSWKRGVLGHCAKIQRMIKTGEAPAQIHVAFMGDEHEGVCNSYTNQPHTIELNRSEQLELDYDLRVWTIREVLALGLPVSVSSVISNHGEYTRNGGKDPVTTRNDNSSTYVARQVKRLFDELEPHTGQHVEWTIGDGAPGVVVELAGEKVYFSHGYVEKGRGASTELRTKSAIERQILGKTMEYGGVRLWFMAHYHHDYHLHFEGRTVFGCPALEAERSSEYMLEQFGVWSVPGMLGVLVGSHLPGGWSEQTIY